ncbi:MAG: hypothetical protein JXC32_02030, partial [Anaerolineae bacterium]|nr:hypothetical protein [Anaerolineae bacterium]
VRIAADGQSGSALVQVMDEGIGISQADLQQVGRRFYRAEKSRARSRHPSQGGSGLGLSIAVALVEAHGGRLWVDSREGNGTTVSFTLPTA